MASVVAYRRFASGNPSQEDLGKAREMGYRRVFLGYVHEVADMKMYETFAKTGWTTKLARQTNEQLMPLIIKAVTIGWLLASEKSLEQAK